MRLAQIAALAGAVSGPLGVAATAGVVPISITHTGRSKVPIQRRADNTYSQTITNNISYGGYFASISVGTPAQAQDVVLDTGSSDLWLLSSTSSLCSDSGLSSPFGGTSGRKQRRQSSTCISTFDSSSSSSFTNLSTIFDIEYVDGSEVEGYYFTDNVVVGGAEIDSVQMGLADTSTIEYGIMGIGFESDEAAQTIYPNIIDDFYTQGLIEARAYSLYLDDLDDSTGTILFGGVDTDKYTGEMIAVPIIKDSAANNYTAFYVTLSSVAAVDSNGTVSSNYTMSSQAVVLDSGTTLTYLPESVADDIFTTFGATYDENLGYATVDCNLASESDLSLAFQFGGYDGPTITVGLDELLISTGSDMGVDDDDSSGSGGRGSTSTQESTCAFGISMSDSTFLLGDTFLRSAYVVYHLDAKLIGMAQSNLNSSTTSITAITSTSEIPGVSSTATAETASTTGSDGTTSSSSRSAAAGAAAVPWVTVALGAVAGAMMFV